MRATPNAHPQDPDDRTMARAVLAWCTDGPDALMQAAVHGMGDPRSALDHIESLRDLSMTDIRSSKQGRLNVLDEAFRAGVEDWGGRVNDAAVRVFRRSLVRWSTRLNGLPGDNDDRRLLLTANRTQWIIGPEHPSWPIRINDLSERRDWATPLCLWGQGDISSLVTCDEPIAVVGSRGCDDYGRSVASDIAHELAAAGHTVISGGAMGTDAAAHWGAIRAWNDASPSTPPGRTVAIFAGGLDRAGPQCNLRLFHAILDRHGALISELAPGTVPVARRFLLRNRLIAGLSCAVVVAQARIRSGALNTAGWANELGRRVYAIPGRIDSPRNAGCHQLIRDSQAILLHSTTDIDDLARDDHACENPSPCNDSVGYGNGISNGMRTCERDSRALPSEGLCERHPSDDGQWRDLPDGDTAMTVLKEIRSCARDHVPATMDEIERRLNMRRPSGVTSMGELLATISLMEIRGIVEVRSGAVIASTGLRANPHALEPHRPDSAHHLF
ncbi:DNA-processing protein DprA [uncultured Bifidobacterium sp.]|uniref:DNA-processing protein DprA n=1 Tax=uncultured Bifidobacterium sp. TaxID=165187 RepID=UPI0026146F35|nr:DNA-processing protein DprA [uncultured Bifidobacterium sp.]